MTKYVCPICGYVHEGNEPPEKCPQCGCAGAKFLVKEASDKMTWACEHEIGVAKGLDAEVVKGLEMNFTGECTEVTKKNLELRAAAEQGACEGKLQLAKRAKELNYDAVHDTVHEMAKDEARHGAGFEGLLKRYFK